MTTGLVAMALAGCGSAAGSGSGASKDVIKIGQQCDLSGDMANPAGYYGAQLAVEEINAAGGLLGKQVELVVVDTQTDTTRYQEMTKKLLLQDEVDVIMGYGTSAAREVIRPIVEEYEGLYFYNSMYEDGVVSNNVICTGMVPEQQNLPMIAYMAEQGIKTVYVLYPDYNYGHICAQWTEKFCEEYGVEIVAEEFEPITVSEFSSSISRIRESGAEALLFCGPSGPMRSFWEQWVATGSDIPVYTATNIAGYYEHKQIEAPALEGTVTCSVWMEEFSQLSDDAKAFVDNIYAKHPEVDYVSHNYFLSYIAVHLYAEAVKKAGSTDVAKVLEAIESGEVSYNGPMGVASIVPETHHVTMNMSLAQVNAEHGIDVLKRFENVEPTWLRDTMNVDLRTMKLHTQLTLEDAPLSK